MWRLILLRTFGSRFRMSDVEEGVVDARLAAGSVVGSVAGSVHGIVTARAPTVADAAWHRELPGQDGRAGASGRCKHAIRDGWSAKVAEFRMTSWVHRRIFSGS